jgi:uroporphyrinogen decarboxylase
MTPRDRVIRTLNHQAIDRAPRDLWLAHGVAANRADEAAEIANRFPNDILQLDTKSPAGKQTKGAAQRAGHFCDAWGCSWQLGPHGAAGPSCDPLLTDPAKIATYEPPAELLEPARFSRASRGGDGSIRFVLAWSETRPLDRLQLLCGREGVLHELAAGDKDLRGLLSKLHDFFMQELQLWANTDVDGVALRDDLGLPGGLRIPAKTWRSLLKPMYRQYCDILHAKDKFVFFHSDGQISDLVGDLIDIGIDALHSQLHLMDFETLAGKHRGRVTFWGEIDRPGLEPPRSPAEVQHSVLRVRRALDFGGGGVIAQCTWAENTPLRNIASFFEQWMTPLPVGV